jgi:hypothetical protein
MSIPLLNGPIAPMLATIGRQMPNGGEWVLEPKWDGIRALAHVCPDRPRLFTRGGRAPRPVPGDQPRARRATRRHRVRR